MQYSHLWTIFPKSQKKQCHYVDKKYVKSIRANGLEDLHILFYPRSRLFFKRVQIVKFLFIVESLKNNMNLSD